MGYRLQQIPSTGRLCHSLVSSTPSRLRYTKVQCQLRLHALDLLLIGTKKRPCHVTGLDPTFIRDRLSQRCSAKLPFHANDTVGSVKGPRQRPRLSIHPCSTVREFSSTKFPSLLLPLASPGPRSLANTSWVTINPLDTPLLPLINKPSIRPGVHHCIRDG